MSGTTLDPNQVLGILNLAAESTQRQAGGFLGKVDFEDKTVNPFFDQVFDVTPEEVKAKQNLVCLIDVRQHEEFVGELGHIDGAKLIVLDELPGQIQKLDRSQTIVFVCRSGARSARAAAYAASHGFNSVYNMAGGMIRWNELAFAISKEEIE